MSRLSLCRCLCLCLRLCLCLCLCVPAIEAPIGSSYIGEMWPAHVPEFSVAISSPSNLLSVGFFSRVSKDQRTALRAEATQEGTSALAAAEVLGAMDGSWPDEFNEDVMEFCLIALRPLRMQLRSSRRIFRRAKPMPSGQFC